MFRKKINFDLDEFRSWPLPSEQEIMSGWTGDLDKPVVSVICNTYNQEMYIEDAIRGFLIQETGFPFEVIINDDASTDRNPEIIKVYTEKYPNIIKPVFQKENQYSQGRKPSVISFPYTSGAYIALCEGDDFWINSNKLKTQFEVIDSDQQISLILSPGFRLSGEETVDGIFNVHAGSRKSVTAQDILDVPGQFAPTASYFMRRDVLATLPAWFNKAPYGDLFIELWAFTVGEVHYLPVPHSVYRINAVGSWTRSQKSNPIEKIDKMALQAEECFFELMKLKNFCEIDISTKKSSWEFGKALFFLKEKEYRKFRAAIIRSVEVKKFFSRGQAFSYYFRFFPALVRLVFLASR